MCSKLHNFCIRMQQKDGRGRVGFLPDYDTNLRSLGITSLDDGPQRSSEYGYLPTVDVESDKDSITEDDDDHVDLNNGVDDPPNSIGTKYSSLQYDDLRRRSILAEIKEFGMNRPRHNIERNNNNKSG